MPTFDIKLILNSIIDASGCPKEHILSLYKYLTDNALLNYKWKSDLQKLLYKYRDDIEFMKQTAHIHREREWLKNFSLTEHEQRYILYMHIISNTLNIEIPTFKQIKEMANPNRNHPPNADVLYIYAYCLGQGLYEVQNKDFALKLYKYNYEIHKHPDSLYEIIHFICDDAHTQNILYMQNWKFNYHVNSLIDYATNVKWGKGCPKDIHNAINLFKISWDDFKSSEGLDAYISTKTEYEDESKEALIFAREMHKFNWEINNSLEGLLSYAYYLDEGLGGPKDKEEAKLLYRKGWEIYKYDFCLTKYIRMLRLGNPAEQKIADDLCELYWDKVEQSTILYYYADNLLKGRSVPKDEYLGYGIHLMNWQKHEDYDSLYEVINCLEKGRGCEKNLELSEKYYKIYDQNA